MPISSPIHGILMSEFASSASFGGGGSHMHSKMTHIEPQCKKHHFTLLNMFTSTSREYMVYLSFKELYNIKASLKLTMMGNVT